MHRIFVVHHWKVILDIQRERQLKIVVKVLGENEGFGLDYILMYVASNWVIKLRCVMVPVVSLSVMIVFCVFCELDACLPLCVLFLWQIKKL